MNQDDGTQSPLNDPDVARLRKLANRMDNAFRLPIIETRIGWDSILGLVPVVGDVLAMAPAVYIVKEAHRLGVSPFTLTKMGANLGIDLAIGAIPLVGDIFDVGWNANIRNVELLHRHLLLESETKKGDPKAAPISPSETAR